MFDICKKYSRIEHIDIGITFDTGSLRSDCSEVSRLYCYFDRTDNEQLIKIVSKDLFCDEHGVCLVESLLPKVDLTLGLDKVVNSIVELLASKIQHLPTKSWNTLSAGRHKSQLRYLTARVGSNTTPLSRQFFTPHKNIELVA